MATFYNFNIQGPTCRAVTTTDLSTLYSNGAGGFGATLTATGNGALIYDGVTFNVDDFILVNGQTLDEENGPYQVTAIGDGFNPFVIMRATFFMSPVIAAPGTTIPISAGTTNSGTLWVLVEPAPEVIGTDPINFVKS